MVASAEWVPRQSRQSRADQEPLTLFDVARRFARRVPLAKLITIEDDVRPYLACIIVDALVAAQDTIYLPKDYDKYQMLEPADWERYKLTMAGRGYNAYGQLTKAPGQVEDTADQVTQMRGEFMEMQRQMHRLMQHITGVS